LQETLAMTKPCLKKQRREAWLWYRNDTGFARNLLERASWLMQGSNAASENTKYFPNSKGAISKMRASFPIVEC